MAESDIALIVIFLLTLYALLMVRPRRRNCELCGLYDLLRLENQIIQSCISQDEQNYIKLPLEGYDIYDVAMNQRSAEPEMYRLRIN